MTPVKPIVQMRQCAGCPAMFATPHAAGWPAVYHSAACAQAAARARAPKRSPRAPLVTRPSSKQRRAISPASTEQRAKRATQPCLVTGATTGLDPAHLARRGCDDPLCTVSLTREQHRLFDDGKLDLLPYLLKAGCVEEIAHAVQHYDGRLPALLQRLTGTRWAPASAEAA